MHGVFCHFLSLSWHSLKTDLDSLYCHLFFFVFLVQLTSRLHNGSLYVIVNMVNKVNKSENAGSECNHVFPLAWLQTLIARKLET